MRKNKTSKKEIFKIEITTIFTYTFSMYKCQYSLNPMTFFNCFIRQITFIHFKLMQLFGRITIKSNKADCFSKDYTTTMTIRIISIVFVIKYLD